MNKEQSTSSLKFRMEKLLDERRIDSIIQKIDSKDPTSSEERSFRYLSFATALRSLLPIWDSAVLRNLVCDDSPSKETLNSKQSLAQWLYRKCLLVQMTPEDAIALAVSILSTCQTHCDPNDRQASSTADVELQSALFDILGESESATALLFEIVPRAPDLVRHHVTPDDLCLCITSSHST